MKIFKTIKGNAGLLILAVCFGLLMGAGVRSCESHPTVNRIVEKDSTVYTIIDSTWIVWDTVTYKIVNPTPITTVSANTNNLEDAIPHANCACDSVRNYAGRIPLQSGFVNYNITTLGKIKEMIFSPQIGVENRFRNMEKLRYYTKTETIDNTPHWWLFAGAEVNPQSLSSMSVFADVHSKKWLLGYRYELNNNQPHNVRLGIKIFQL